jgi:hypothetical protein
MPKIPTDLGVAKMPQFSIKAVIVFRDILANARIYKTVCWAENIKAIVGSAWKTFEMPNSANC